MSDWFLTEAERGNSATDLDRAWSTGNSVRLLVHGAVYFQRLYDELRGLTSGDRVFFTDWRGDADELLTEDGPTIGDLLCELVRTGVEVRGLLWRSHSDHLQLSAQENQRLGTELNEAGGEVLLDQRVRRLASHHQKLFVIRHKGRLRVGRRVRRRDRPVSPTPGRPAAPRRSAAGTDGPAVRSADAVARRDAGVAWPGGRGCPPHFRRALGRSASARPANAVPDVRAAEGRMPRHPSKLPETFPDPPVAGQHAVQLLRTFGHKHPPFRFAPQGEYSVARAYRKAFGRAQRLIYCEDQYLWSAVVAEGLL